MSVITFAGTHSQDLAISKSTDPAHAVAATCMGGDSAGQRLQSKVSLFNGVDPEPVGEWTLEAILGAIRDGQWKHEVGEVRSVYDAELKRSKDSKAAKKAAAPLKTRLAGMTASGRFNRRHRDGLVVHSGILVMDIDEVEDQLNEIWGKVVSDPYTLFAFLSPSGNGIKVGIAIPPDSNVHHASFLTAERYAKEHFGVEIDKACKDPARLCFVSYDEQLFINPQAEILEVDLLLQEAPTQARAGGATLRRITNDRPQTAPEHPPEAASSIQTEEKQTTDWSQILKEDPDLFHAKIRRALAYIDPATLHRDDWALSVGAALHSVYKGADNGLNLWDEWSKRDWKRYDQSAIETQWNSFDADGGIGVGSLFRLAHEFGWRWSETSGAWFQQQFPPAVAKYGSPVRERWVRKRPQGSEEGQHDAWVLAIEGINEDFMAAILGFDGSPGCPTVYDSERGTFLRYDPEGGIYIPISESDVEKDLSSILLDCGRSLTKKCGRDEFLFAFRSHRALAGVISKAKGILAVGPDYFQRPAGFIPCANGDLELSTEKLWRISAKRPWRARWAVPFARATKPPVKWLSVLERLFPHAEDRRTFQVWSGMLLSGVNVGQVMLLLMGKPRTGKGTVVRSLIGLLGADNVATLRTKHLEDRFELARLFDKLLLFGADVPADFLNTPGARVLKAITGGDPLQYEHKGSNLSPPARPITGLPLVVSNSRLRVVLEGDEDAWRRRLMVFDCDGDSVGIDQTVPDLDRQIIADEGSAVLNWCLEGLRLFEADGRRILLSERQQSIRDTLLDESNSACVWLLERVEAQVGSTLYVEEAFEDYIQWAIQRDWTPLPRKPFTARLTPFVLQKFSVTVRHDLPRGRGWRGLALRVEDSDAGEENELPVRRGRRR